MSSDWQIVKLGDLISVKHGFAFKSEHFREEPTPYQLVTPGNFAIGGGFQLGKGKYYLGPIPDDYVLQKGSIVVTMTDLSRGTDTLGYAAVIPKTEGTIWLHNQRVGLVEIKLNAPVRGEYLHYLMRSRDYRHQVVSSASGSTVKHTAPSRICEFRFQLPPLREQHEISTILGALDDRITLLRETNATLEAIAQALFKSWFVDFDPVHAMQAGHAPEGMDEATAALFPDGFEESELGLVPKGWRVAPLGDVVATVGGGTPNTKDPSFWEPAEHCWTTPKDLSGAHAPVLLDTERKLSAKGIAKISSGLLPVGTLLMSSRAPIGYLALTNVPMAINQGYIAMPPGSVLPPLYMLFWCRENMETIKNHANGSTFMEVSKKAFRPLPVLTPSAEVLREFHSVAGALFDRVIENEQKAQTLATLRDTLLPRLISGRLRLPKAEAAVEGARVSTDVAA